MKVAFISEMGFSGKVSHDHTNMRTEFAWMYALKADHFNIGLYNSVTNYDHVFIIFPKGQLNLNVVGAKLANIPNPVSQINETDWLLQLKANNKKVYFIQEGPHWIYNDLETADQIHFFNMLASVDAIFAHNYSDVPYYKGLVPGTPVHTMPTLMIENLIQNIKSEKEDKVIVGGNFARWYGGFESYIVARESNLPIWSQTSHAMRAGEDQLMQHLPRVSWYDWMVQLSSFKFAVHLMPTVAAGTFSLNCAYFGIPCIGNREVDTQKMCHPQLSVDVHDLHRARELVIELTKNQSFYEDCAYTAMNNYNLFYSLESWKEIVIPILNGSNS